MSVYIAIDLKSFYASVECQQRGLDPLHTNLVTADASRTEKTICLAVSPSLKAYGIPGRARLFEVVQAVKKINEKRRQAIHGAPFHGSSCDERELQKDPYLSLDFITATPRMSLYIRYSADIYKIYLRYISPDDIHVYSIDEVFMDVSEYLNLYQMKAHELAEKLIKEVLKETGITATAGIGTNLYLCKVAMDVVAKHIPADKDGVRIAELDEYSYREKLWTHRPLTDFWRVGRGTARKLEAQGIYTMGDVARCSIGKSDDYYNEDLLYKMFGVNAELLIDHAWGYEPCTIAAIKAYHPKDHSLGISQVLSCAYSHEAGGIIVKEMIDQLSLELVEKHVVTDALSIMIGFDASGLKSTYHGSVEKDWYGRKVPASVSGIVRLERRTSSSSLMREKAMEFYEQRTDHRLPIHRVTVAALNLKDEKLEGHAGDSVQLDLFADTKAQDEQEKRISEKLAKEKKAEEAILSIRKKFGKNAVIKGMDLQNEATTVERNNEIGGHKA